MLYDGDHLVHVDPEKGKYRLWDEKKLFTMTLGARE